MNEKQIEERLGDLAKLVGQTVTVTSDEGGPDRHLEFVGTHSDAYGTNIWVVVRTKGAQLEFAHPSRVNLPTVKASKEVLEAELTDWKQQLTEARNDSVEASERVYTALASVVGLAMQLSELSNG